MKKLVQGLMGFMCLLLTVSCSQVGLVESRGLIPARVSDLQTNGYLNFDNIFFYLDVDDNSDYSEGIDIAIAYKNGTLVLPEVVGSLANTTAVVRIKPKNAQSRKTYRFRNTADTTWIDVICTKGIQADTTTDAAVAGWHNRFGLGTKDNKSTYKPFYPGTTVSVKVVSNPTQLSVALDKKETNGSFDIAQIDFYLDADGNGAYTSGTDTVIEYKEGKLVLTDLTSHVAENTSVPVLIKPKDDSAVKYSFISADERNWTGVVFANILNVSPTTAATQDGWYQRYNQGTEASKYTYSALTATYKLYITIDKRGENPGGGEPENPGGGEPENPGGGEPENPGGGEPENPGGDEPENPGGGEPENPGGSTITGIKISSKETKDYLNMEGLDFYLDVNADEKFTAGTDLPVPYANGSFTFPKIAVGSFDANTTKIVYVQPKNAGSRKKYVLTNDANTSTLSLVYVTGVSGASTVTATEDWSLRYGNSSPYNYGKIYADSAIGIRQASTVISLEMQISKYSTSDAKVFDITKIDFYLDIDEDKAFTAADIEIEYKDGKLVLPDRTDIVPFGEYRQVLMKSKLENSLRTYGFKRGNNPVDLVLANIVAETSATKGSQDGWYCRYPQNNPVTYSSALTASTADITVTITSKETALPILSSTVTNQGVPIDKLEFYVDRDNNQEFSEGDNTLEYVENNGTWSIALPDKVTNNISVPTGEFRRVMIKPYEGKTYHFVATANPQNLGGYKSIVLRPDTDTNKTWLLASSATSSFGIGAILCMYVYFQPREKSPDPCPHREPFPKKLTHQQEHAAALLCVFPL